MLLMEKRVLTKSEEGRLLIYTRLASTRGDGDHDDVVSTLISLMEKPSSSREFGANAAHCRRHTVTATINLYATPCKLYAEEVYTCPCFKAVDLGNVPP